MRHANERLAAHILARQSEVAIKADSAADRAERAVRRVWNDLLRLIRSGEPWHVIHRRAILLLAGLHGEVAGTVAASLRHVAKWGRQTAVAAVKHSVPPEFLLGAAERKWNVQQTGTGDDSPRVRSGGDDGNQPKLRTDSRSLGEHRQVSELSGMGCSDSNNDSVLLGTRTLRPLTEKRDDPPLEFTDFLVPFRGDTPDPTADIWAFLFPAFTPEQVDSVVFKGDWQARLAAATRLASPATLAQIITSGLIGGKSHQEIARELKPHVQGVVSSARRVARTESLRVAGAVQMDAHEGLGDLVIGFQLLATLDQHSRSWHAARNGQVYFKAPGPGQKGMRQCPHPPDEPDDPGERPAGTPHTAFS